MWKQRPFTIKRKLLLINAVIAIVPLLIIGAIIAGIYQNTVDKRTKQSVTDSSVVIADRITRVLKDTESCSNYLTININEVLKEKDPLEKINLRKQRDVTNELYNAKIVFDEMESIAFISDSNQIFVSDNAMLKNAEIVKDSEQFEQLKETSGKSIWFPCETREFLVLDKEKPVVTLGKKVVKITTGETLGYILINVNMEQLESVLRNQLIHYRLEDSTGKQVCSVPATENISAKYIEDIIRSVGEYKTGIYEGKNYYVTSYNIAEYGWKLTSVADLYTLNVGAKKIIYLVVLVAIAVIIMEIILYNYLSRIITVPLEHLKMGAEKMASGNMDLRLRITSNDEIGKLGEAFNHMAEQVQELLIKVEFEARKKKEYELSLLHEQVKPHFLYNSLDIITKLSEMNRQVESRRAIRRLADYYRNSLSDSKEIITLEQEIKIVEDYLELQRIRYTDVFTYEVEVEEGITNIVIPKLSLQPLVENAIYHGLKYKESKGVLRIKGERREGCMCVSVYDNGVGMEENYLHEILTNQPNGHFGVYSVNHRIKLYFGESYGLTVKSVVGEGTCVEMILPDETGE